MICKIYCTLIIPPDIWARLSWGLHMYSFLDKPFPNLSCFLIMIFEHPLELIFFL